MISWRQAWSHVAAGHWYAERGEFTGGPGPSHLDAFDATSVELAYLGQDGPVDRISAIERDDLVPMWVFSNADGAQLFYPAVAPSSLTYTWAP